MSRGGSRIGAGRPIGTVKLNNKKMYSFRLSADEAIAVKNLLRELRSKNEKSI